MNEEGIFRLSGVNTELEEIKKEYDKSCFFYMFYD